MLMVYPFHMPFLKMSYTKYIYCIINVYAIPRLFIYLVYVFHMPLLMLCWLCAVASSNNDRTVAG